MQKNSNTQIVTKLKNLDSDKTKQLKLRQPLIQIVTKLKHTIGDNTQKLKLFKNSKTQFVTKLKTHIVTKLKKYSSDKTDELKF